MQVERYVWCETEARGREKRRWVSPGYVRLDPFFCTGLALNEDLL